VQLKNYAINIKFNLSNILFCSGSKNWTLRTSINIKPYVAPGDDRWKYPGQWGSYPYLRQPGGHRHISTHNHGDLYTLKRGTTHWDKLYNLVNFRNQRWCDKASALVLVIAHKWTDSFVFWADKAYGNPYGHLWYRGRVYGTGIGGVG